MVSIREWVALGMGLTTGGVGVWALARRSRPGQILSIGVEAHALREAIGPAMYLVQESVVKAVAARAASVARRGKQSRVDMLLIGIHRRGVLSFVWAEQAPKYGNLYEVSMLDTERGLPEWGIKPGEPAPNIRDVLVELAAYGLARPGLAFRSYADFMKGKASGPLNLEVVRDAPRVVEVEVERQRPSGSYFKIGDSYYADGRFLERMEWIPGSEYDENTYTTTVPLWKRGKLLFQEMGGKARILPEQQGGLYLLKGELAGVDLEDVLTELVELGLVGWGGEWTTMPKELDSRAPDGGVLYMTGTPKWNPSGKVRSYEGQEFIDEATLRQMLTRLESTRSPDGTIQITWRGRSLQLRPTATTMSAVPGSHRIELTPGSSVARLVSAAGSIPGTEGKLYALGPSSDPDVKALVDELILRRLAYRVKEASPRMRRPDQPVGHIYYGDELRLVDEAFVEAMHVRADGFSFNPNDLSIHLRYGLNGEVYLRPWDLEMGIAPTLVDQVGGAYVLALKGPYGMKPDEKWFSQLVGDIIDSGEGNSLRGTPLIVSTEVVAPAPPGHLYTGDPPIIDGRLAGLIKPYAERVIVVEFGVDLDLGEVGMISLRLLSQKVGPMLAAGLLPNQVGAAFEVDLSRLSPQHPLWFRDLVTSLVEKGEAKRVEIPAPKTVSVKYRSFLSPEAGQP